LVFEQASFTQTVSKKLAKNPAKGHSILMDFLKILFSVTCKLDALMKISIALALLHAPAAAQPPEHPITRLQEIREMPVEIAASGVPVAVQGTVLYADPANGDLMLYDGTSTCYTNAGSFQTPSIGTRVRASGHTNASGYSPHFNINKLTITGHAEIPPPALLSAGDIYLPSIDVKWIEVPAIVTGVESGGLAYTLTTEVYGQIFKADTPLVPDATERAARLMQRPVRMRAILCTVFNEHHQMTGRHFLVPSFDDLIPTSPEVDLSKARVIKITELLTRNNGPYDLVRIEGCVTQLDAKGFTIRDSSGSTLVLTPLGRNILPGMHVSIIGYGAIAPFRPVFRATSVRKIGLDSPPAPRAMSLHTSETPDLHMELVTVKADFLGLRSGKDEAVFQCRTGSDVFDAILPQNSGTPPSLTPGDIISLTGVCELFTNHPLPRPGWISGFRLQLAGADQIQVINHAPWWNQRRLLIALAITTGATIVFGMVVVALRKRIKHQVAIIANKIEANAVSSERERMARDLHDTLEQQLTGVAMQLESLSNSPHPKSSAITERLTLASRMLQHSREEARRSVWDLRNKVLETYGFAAALESLAASAAIDGGPNVSTRITGSRAHLPSTITFQLLRMAQEALANALKHSKASNILITLDMADREYVLVIRDDGRGFDAEVHAPPGPPHFGLIGMHERASKIGATLNIESQPGCGCIVAITYPLFS
jgi:signal transduction histidine kinase